MLKGGKSIFYIIGYWRFCMQFLATREYYTNKTKFILFI